MNIALIEKWISNIEFEDGEKLSLGSLRTLGDIKKEIKSEESENLLLGAKHTGMRMSAPGILKRVPGDLHWAAGEMLKHLREMAERYYNDDIKAVDEFLQLYCLDEKRPQ